MVPLIRMDMRFNFSWYLLKKKQRPFLTCLRSVYAVHINRLALFTLVFLSMCLPLQAQTPESAEEKMLQQLYAGAGIGLAFTKADNLANTGGTLSLNLSAAFRNRLMLRAGYQHNSFADDLSRSQDPEKIRGREPNHRLKTHYLAAGRKLVISPYIHLQAFAGVGITRYQEPYNIHLAQKTTLWLFSNTTVRYNTKIHQQPGLLLQAEALFLSFRWVGITMGGYYHFVPGISNAGLSISVNPGLLSRDTSDLY